MGDPGRASGLQDQSAHERAAGAPERVAAAPERAAVAPGRTTERGGGVGRPLDPVGGLLAALVAVPVLAAGVRLAAAGWTPALDDGFLVVRAFDAVTSDMPLVGQYSMADAGDGPPAHSLGPMLYWLLVGPVRLGPAWFLPVWMAVVNGACLAFTVVLVHRRAGRWAAAATALGLALAVRSMRPTLFAAVWNPWAAMAPLVLLVAVAWAIAAGDRRLWPLAVLLASFCAQAHLTYVFPALGLLAVAAAFDAGSTVARRRRPGGATRGPRWPLVAAVVVGAACWAPPVVDQLTGDPGNLTVVADANDADRERAGADAAGAAISRSTGVVPSFAEADRLEGLAVVAGSAGPAWRTGSAAALLVAIAAMGAVSARRRDRVTGSAVAIALVLVGAAALVAASMPLERRIASVYSFRWFTLAGLVAWLALGLAVARVAKVVVVGGGATGATPPAPTPRSWRHAAAGIAAVAVVAVAVVAADGPIGPKATWPFAPADRLGDEVVAATEPGERYVLDPSGQFDIAFTPALAWRLREAGRHPVLHGNRGDAFGERYKPAGERCAGRIVLQDRLAELPAGGRRIGRAPLRDAPGNEPFVWLVLSPDQSRAGLC